MDALPKPPLGSLMTVDLEGSSVRIGIPPIRADRSRWGAVAFLSFWLCGWLLGECSALFMLISGLADWKMSWPVGIFLVAWLGGWTFGGISAIRTLRGLLRKPDPGSLKLSPSQLEYTVEGGPDESDIRATWRSRRTESFVVPREESSEPRLERAHGYTRLSIDHGCKRIDIEARLTEPEKEWLFTLLERWKRIGSTS